MNIKKLLGKISMAAIALGVMCVPFVSKAADFDATSTTGILSTALAAVTPTLIYGVGAILVVSLGLWAIFFVVGKLKRHVK